MLVTGPTFARPTTTLNPNSTTTYMQPPPTVYLPMSSSGPAPAINPKKRPAPGSLPLSMQQQPPPPPPPPLTQQHCPPSSANDLSSLSLWNGTHVANTIDNSVNPLNNAYGMMVGSPSPTQAQFHQSSTALARREPNSQQLITASRPFNPPPQNASWPSFGEEALAPQQNGNGTIDETDSVEVLEERAQRAKREAQAKRKQIPPFVQKLNSFLEESKNTDLIRWSEKGDSFIVLDEDEFAKNLIPELFKHNNYASFVRQLNMYGFHKKIGLSDNSMKASERKNKSPSEYYNPYFRRGHPNLLWLINKPKNTSAKKKGKRAEDGEPESDEDVPVIDGPEQTFTQPGPDLNRALPAPGSGTLQKKDLAVVRDQVRTLQEQQRSIREAIKRLSQQQIEISRQAQQQHDRHEQSINAILSFLFNVYKNSIEDPGGVHNFNDLIARMLPSMQMAQASQGQGSVVDLGEYVRPGVETAESIGPAPRRPQRLLPPATQSAASNGTRPQSASSAQQHPQIGAVTELLDTPTDINSPALPKPTIDTSSQEGMMKIIRDAANSQAQAGNSPIDMSQIAGAAGSPPTSLTTDQRHHFLNMMSHGTAGSSVSTPATAASSVPSPAPTNTTNTADPSVHQYSHPQPTSLSPLLPASLLPTPPPQPHHHHHHHHHHQQLSRTTDEINRLKRLQEEQSHNLQSLNALLGSYSPSGKVPGLADDPAAAAAAAAASTGTAATGYFDEAPIVDFEQYLNQDVGVDGMVGEPGDFDFGGGAFDAGGLDALFGPGPGDGMAGGDNCEGGGFGADGFGDAGAGGIDVDGGGVAIKTSDSAGQTPRTTSSTGIEEVAREDFLGLGLGALGGLGVRGTAGDGGGERATKRLRTG